MLLLFHSEDSSFSVPDFLAVGRVLLALLASWQFFDSVCAVLDGALKGAGDTKFVMYCIAFVGFCLWLPAIFCILRWHPDIVSLWLTYPFYTGILATLFIGRWIRGRWKTIKLVEERDE